MSTTCSICGSNQSKPFFSSFIFGPTGVYHSNAGQTPEKFDIRLEYCSSCYFIQAARNLELTKEYEVIDRSTSGQLPTYADLLLNIISKYLPKQSDLIVELGANDGTFLNLLQERNFENLLGIEPSSKLVELARNKGLNIEEIYFGLETSPCVKEKFGSAGFVLARHTLEHIPDISSFVKGIYDLLSQNGYVLIEVPDTEMIIDQSFIHEIWDEHISYFTKNSLSNLLTEFGFRVEKIFSVNFRNTKNIVCLAQKTEFSDCNKMAVGRKSERHFEKRHLRMIQRWHLMNSRLKLALSKTKGPYFALGASHPQTNFLNYSGLANQIDWLIDDDPNKFGKYVAFTEFVPITNSKSLFVEFSQGTIIDTAFLYPDWAKRLRNDLSAKWKIISPFELN